MSLRIFSAGISTETNTFAPMPTGMASFEEVGLFHAGQHPDRRVHLGGAMILAARLQAEGRGWTLKEGLAASASPSGTTTRAAYEALRDELLADLKAALPLDVVLLGLHGAMVADGYDDCEGDLLERVRAITGPGVVVGAVLDLHCHLTHAMVNNANVLVTFKEYPHTDVLERALEVVDLSVAQAEGRIRPVAALVDTGMVLVMHTPREPARGFIDRVMALEGQEGILSISIAQSFPWADVPEMGTRVLVYADGDGAKAAALARKLNEELHALREQFAVPYLGIDEALEQALDTDDGPVVIADRADNAGGGAASDSTFILRRVLERGITGVAIGPLWDPGAVRMATEAGEGARLALRIGGKISPLSGQPVDMDCTVKALRSGYAQTGLTGAPVTLGDSALVECLGVQVLLVTIRRQAYGTDLFTGIGCDLATRCIVVVKSAQHFYASFAKVASKVLYADAPGAMTVDLKSLPYQRIHRPKWPIDA